ncbi:hypothetical protein [Streptomyces sp. NRRL WC-3742]|uniref:hypothetical protein n=1 Tax=Streptomyces sp. NRRL WC-3742 TaxID=1463934 RepID=UPI0004C4FCF1|nr:hypothetical protein [Streptomyces sp. NRRL WC-3742]
MNDSPTVGVTVHLVEPDGAAGPALANGFLAGPTTVLVPDPPQAVGDPWQRYLVQIGTEAVRVAGVSLAAASVDGFRTAAAVLALVEPSRNAAPAEVRTTLAALTDSLRRHRGDLWSTYADLGFPVEPPEVDDSGAPADTWWLSLAVDDLVVFAGGICCITVNCGGCRTK